MKCLLGKVFVVIPVFNRKERTESCVKLLQKQTYADYDDVEIIVCDGGSTDGTVELLRSNYPSITVLVPKTEKWWGGSTKMGVDYVLRHAKSNDFLIIMNDDTVFEVDYITKLVAASRKYTAAICGIVVREDDPSWIMDAGVAINWEKLSFIAKDKTLSPPSGVDLDCAVLPGRGTIFPMWAVIAAGSIDEDNFPHYLSDYEFSYRVKVKSGIRLAVLYTAKILTEYVPQNEGVVVEEEMPGAFAEFMRRLKKRFSKRTKQNLPSSLAFIGKHAPKTVKRRVTKKILRDNVAYIFHPLARGARSNPIIRPFILPFNYLFIALPKKIGSVMVGPYIVPRSDLHKFDLDALPLHQHNILAKSRFENYFLVKRKREYIVSRYPSALPMYDHGSKLLVKIGRVLHSRGLSRPFELLYRYALGPYLITQKEATNLGLDFLKLRQHNILAKTVYPDMFSFGQPLHYIRAHYPEAEEAYRYAKKLNVKWPRVLTNKFNKKPS